MKKISKKTFIFGIAFFVVLGIAGGIENGAPLWESILCFPALTVMVLCVKNTNRIVEVEDEDD